MLISPEYAGIEIPIFNPETQVVNLISDPLEQDGETFVRGVRAAPGSDKYFRDLPEYLDFADEELKTAADACGAQVVPHEWGLFELPDNAPRRLTHFSEHNHNIVPEGYILVAETELIREISWVLNLGDKIDVNNGIRAYSQSKKPGDLMFTDNYSHQYASGVTMSSKGKRVLWLVDIDLEIGLV